MPKLSRNIQYSPPVSTTAVEEIIDGLFPTETLTFSYNLDNTVSNISGPTTSIDFTYNLDKTVNTVDDQDYIRTFSYNPNKTVDAITVSDS